MNKPHAIIVPVPLQGHVTPTVQLAIKLASKGFSITFINLEHVHHKITRSNPNPARDGMDIFAEARDSMGLDIDYMTVSDGLPLEFDRMAKSNQEEMVRATMHCLPAHVEAAVTKIIKSRPSTCCFIADKFSIWAPNLASKFGLVYVSFSSEAVMVLNVGFHISLLQENGHIGPGASSRNDPIDYIPGIPSIKRMDLVSFLHNEDLTSIDHQYIAKVMNTAKGADFILVNSVQELEAHSLEAIQAQAPPIYAIGPLLSPKLTNGLVSTNLWAQSDCMHWLDSKPPGSVLYVSFGSVAQLSKEEFKEIANGIKLSGVNFLWVLRSDGVRSNDPEPLPFGFKDEDCGRGMIVSWTDQTAVLSHHAIGGFLTHCGWNSTLESIWCEVPSLCFPLTSDQFTNRKLMVDDWKIGFNLCEEKPVKEEEVLQKIKDLLGGSMRYELNANIKRIKGLLEASIATDGSSEKNYDRFIEDVVNAFAKKKFEN